MLNVSLVVLLITLIKLCRICKCSCEIEEGIKNLYSESNLKAWTQCYSVPYSTPTTIGILRSNCDYGDNTYWFVAAKETKESNKFYIGAYVESNLIANVIGSQSTAIESDINPGTYWYHRRWEAIGFADTNTIDLRPCDKYEENDNNKRLCWHLNAHFEDNHNGGYRAGTHTNLNNNNNWYKEVYYCTVNPTIPDLSVRLVGSEYLNKGRLEIFYNNQWGTVCNDKFQDNKNAANVICDELGYDVAKRYFSYQLDKIRPFGSAPDDQRIWLDNVICDGSELSIESCNFKLANHNCNHKEDINIVCDYNYISDIRLYGGSHDYEGRLQVKHNNQWGTVCNDVFQDNTNAGNVICKELGYSRGLKEQYSKQLDGDIDDKIFPNTIMAGKIWLDNVKCNGNEDSINECQFKFDDHNCKHREDMNLICYKD